MQEIRINRLNDTLRYNDLATNYGGWGLVFFVEENRYLVGDGPNHPQKVLRVWLTDHNVQNYTSGKSLMIINESIANMPGPRAIGRIIAAVNPKMAKRMGDSVKDAIRNEGLRADTPIDVVERLRVLENVNGPREAA